MPARRQPYITADPDTAIACLPLINGAREERHIFGMLHLYGCLTDSSAVNPRATPHWTSAAASL